MGTGLEIKGYCQYGMKRAREIDFPWVKPPKLLSGTECSVQEPNTYKYMRYTNLEQ